MHLNAKAPIRIKLVARSTAEIGLHQVLEDGRRKGRGEPWIGQQIIWDETAILRWCRFKSVKTVDGISKPVLSAEKMAEKRRIHDLAGCRNRRQEASGDGLITL